MSVDWGAVAAIVAMAFVAALVLVSRQGRPQWCRCGELPYGPVRDTDLLAVASAVGVARHG